MSYCDFSIFSHPVKLQFDKNNNNNKNNSVPTTCRFGVASMEIDLSRKKSNIST